MGTRDLIRSLPLWAFAAFGTLAYAENLPCLSPNEACSERLSVKDGWVRIYATHPLRSSSPTVQTPVVAAAGPKRALVMVHGAARNGDGYFGTALAAAASQGELLDTVIIAPSFKGIDGPSCRDTVEDGELVFGCQAWNAGFAATNSELKATSFDAMDRILQLLGDRARFPNLRSITVAGHSGGGQFVQRYAAMNHAETRLHMPVKYVVANPSSYVYLNEYRLRPEASCTQDGICTGGFGPYWDRTNCSGYNKYRYGLEGLTGYASTMTTGTIRRQFVKRDVTYLIGDLDTLQDSDLDKSCSAQAQGPNRRERGLNFWNYMREEFHATHQIVVVPRCGHNAACMFGSQAGARTLFP
ncbi:hypothetical protein F183_A46140 [Bryobacterales bacterium F-183]|nr:hypothetical protein F183_A46140 [Bryobacterales bacterium F-183]